MLAQALAPDLKRKVDANRAARIAQERVLKQQVEAQASHPSLCRWTRVTVCRIQAGDSEAAKPIWVDLQK
ncbi:hypothetical protein JVT61DRAFT_2164 [Boletus reticuloceps]|uniref:Uncharacterized protein n=1 Tax=Boletus reticuloceps TaxID=495285 RepID=A0A8I2YNX2_9AGAM|nr:hypothetical protein JVT61DRAFT_2164 [Boletus reticuloceps]